MAKHPVPKYKKSKSKSRMRHSTWEKNLAKLWEDKVKLNTCPDCGAKKLSHNLCPKCGKYKGRQVVDMEKGKGDIKVVKV